MNTSYVESLVQLLEQVRRRPWAYIGTDPNNIVPFVTGVNLAFAALGIVRDEKIYEEVVNQRGWEYSNFKPIHQIREKIADDEQVVQEYIDLELESWQIFAERKK